MPRPIPTQIVINEHGDEQHESWLLVTLHRSSSTGTRLFDSELTHNQFITVSIHRCTRKRQLNSDYKHPAQLLLEFNMSMAQWGAFVSSQGDGGGTPGTLSFLFDQGLIPAAIDEPRLAVSHAEVRGAANKSLSEVQEAFDKLEELYEAKAGRRELTQAMHNLHYALQNAPANMEFAAKSLTRHVENVVTMAHADIEARVAMAQERGLEAPQTPLPLLLEAVARDTTQDTEG